MIWSFPELTFQGVPVYPWLMRNNQMRSRVGIENPLTSAWTSELGFSASGNFAPRRHLAVSEAIFGCQN